MDPCQPKGNGYNSTHAHTHLMQSMWRLSGKHAARGPKGPKIEKIKTSPRDQNFQAGMKFSSEPPTDPHTFVLWKFLKVVIEVFERD